MVLGSGFCQNTSAPLICSAFWWFIVAFVIFFIVWKYLSPKSPVR